MERTRKTWYSYYDSDFVFKDMMDNLCIMKVGFTCRMHLIYDNSGHVVMW